MMMRTRPQALINLVVLATSSAGASVASSRIDLNIAAALRSGAPAGAAQRRMARPPPSMALSRRACATASSARCAGAQQLRMVATAAEDAPPPTKPPFFVTTPIYYVNGMPHIGHAYTTLACDVIARFKRLDGHEVKFLTGTDEHGQKVEQSAQAAGETPLAFADRVSAIFRSLLDTYDFTCDEFIRTTEARHAEAAQALWGKLLDNGDIYLGAYEGWYSIRDECFYTEEELVDGAAPTGAPVEWVAESSYFFRLSAYTERLRAHIEAHPTFVSPAGRRNEVLAFMREGLRDLSISRCVPRPSRSPGPDASAIASPSDPDAGSAVLPSCSRAAHPADPRMYDAVPTAPPSVGASPSPRTRPTRGRTRGT